MEKPTRRRLLAAGFSGTALSLLGSRAVSASPDTTTPTGDEGSAPAETPGTAAPQRPTQDDVPLLQFAQSFELAARDLYQAAIDAGAEDETLTAVRDNHQAAASILRGLLGTQSTQTRSDDVFGRFERDFATADIGAVANAASELEATAVATHSELVGELAGTDGAQMLASVLVVEARQSVVMADLAGRGGDLRALFDENTRPLSPGPTSGG